MNKNNTVTCSFSMDREVYNAFKSIITRNGENVKGNIVRYMQSVINYDIPNAETIAAIEEVQKMKSDPTIGKTYSNVDEMMRDLLDV
ncbi:hypothetical protein [Lachnoanaerobaculum umeaense]|uniref:Uncharacterized protein n=1 Tax=Lachnoanaerobaculum umeaense TaxID=617123 RepID=A0A385Q1U8_9FIRM|nr:hypothetical protein [Lachnoanaerobaculum umeaense]AYA98513.1 hypothetical protein D4A81_00375 [Lachnoanaerobaculum umeaense]PZW90728.1 hypothetical protein C7439_1562 [Lachnoanaerobaculum umeaense]